MPVVKLGLSRLEKLVGRKFEREELEDLLFRLKCEVEGYSEEDAVEVEVTSDRPDLLASEGVARALKGLLGVERGCPKVELRPSGFSLRVGRVPSRPYIAVGVLYSYKLTEQVLEELIQFQEKLHATVGRGRRKVAIGIHDLSKVPSKELEYVEVDVDEAKMVPLGGRSKATVREVLAETEQGRKYGSISLRGSRHPAILAGGEIISLPPVVNSDVTRLEPGTKGLLVDVTGTDELTVVKTLDVILSVLAEKERSAVGRVAVYANGAETRSTPAFSRGTLEVSERFVSSALGFELKASEIAELLSMARWDAADAGGGKVVATYPEYRVDVMHPVDLVEDVAVAYGYDRIPLTKPSAALRPKRLGAREFERMLAKLAAGLGFLEVHSFVMVPSKLASASLESAEGAAAALLLENPIAEDMDAVRPSAAPSLLLAAAESQGSPLPLKLFEVGDCGYVGASGIPVSTRCFGMLVVDHAVGFEDVQAPAFALLRALGLEPSTKRLEVGGKGLFAKGRAALLTADGRRVGTLGEVNPELVVELGLAYPAAIAAVDAKKLYEVWAERR